MTDKDLDLYDVIPDNRYVESYWSSRKFDQNRLVSVSNIWRPPVYFPFRLEDLICIHLTDQEVNDGYLKPRSYHPIEENKEQWFFPRETLHFTLNGIVAEHRGGDILSPQYSWRKNKIAYLIPLKDIIDQVIYLFTHDTIILGKIKLPDSTIVLPNHKDKILKRIKKEGYQPLDIHGVLSLDSAFLLGTEYNINHPHNFDKIREKYEIDQAYTSNSINNILYLDNLLGELYYYIVKNSSPLDNPHDLMNDIENRLSYIIQKYKSNSQKKKAALRFKRGVKVYLEMLDRKISMNNKIDELWNLRKTKKITETEHRSRFSHLEDSFDAERDLIRWKE